MLPYWLGKQGAAFCAALHLASMADQYHMLSSVIADGLFDILKGMYSRADKVKATRSGILAYEGTSG